MSSSEEKYSSDEARRQVQEAASSESPPSPSLQRAMQVEHNYSTSPYTSPPLQPGDDVPALGVRTWSHRTCPYCGFQPVTPGATCPSCYRQIPAHGNRRFFWLIPALSIVALVVVIVAAVFFAKNFSHLASNSPNHPAEAAHPATTPHVPTVTPPVTPTMTLPTPTVVAQVGQAHPSTATPRPPTSPPAPTATAAPSDCTNNVIWLNGGYSNTIALPSAYNFTIISQGLFDNKDQRFCHRFRTVTVLWIPNAALDSGTAETLSYVQQADGNITTQPTYFNLQNYTAGTTPTLLGDTVAGNCIYSYFEVDNPAASGSSYSPWKSPSGTAYGSHPTWCP